MVDMPELPSGFEICDKQVRRARLGEFGYRSCSLADNCASDVDDTLNLYAIDIDFGEIVKLGKSFEEPSWIEYRDWCVVRKLSRQSGAHRYHQRLGHCFKEAVATRDVTKCLNFQSHHGGGSSEHSLPR